MTKKHGTNCDIYALQSAIGNTFWASRDSLVLYEGSDREIDRLAKSPTGRLKLLGRAKANLRAACVQVPRTVKTAAEVQALAIKVGKAHGFDAMAGEYYKSPDYTWGK